MTSYAAFLRAVNIGPHNKVPMSDLRSLLTKLGMKDAQTLLQSGNAVFRTDLVGPVEIEQKLEGGCTRHLKVTTEFFVRTLQELEAVIASNPFPKEAEEDPSHLLVLFMKDAPTRASVSALQSAIVGRESVKAVGRQAYFVYRDGIGNSKLTTSVIEKKLGTRGTGRNWNTVLKLTALLRSL
jgi:uncharacterized protein (DUF1697 family)